VEPSPSSPRFGHPYRLAKRNGVLGHPWPIQARSEAAELPLTASVASVGFDAFFADEYERLFRALYFAGDRHDAEELMQDAFLKLWKRWD
jgi:hypothetical protein